jgi:predicted permease
MDSKTASNESDEKKKPSEKQSKPNSENEGATVGIPVMCVIYVPVSIPLDESINGHVCDLNGYRVVNAEDNEESFKKAMEIAVKSPLVDEASTALLTSASRFKFEHPEVKVLFTPLAGVIDEKEIE